MAAAAREVAVQPASAAPRPQRPLAANLASAEPTDRLAILDAGAQYAKVIDRRVRELRVECEILPFDTPAAALSGFRGIILSGGPQSVYGAAAPKYDPGIFRLDVPILGICYGMQLLNYACGGGVSAGAVREDGQIEIEPVSSAASESLLFRGLEGRQTVLLTHGDSVTHLAPGFVLTHRTANGLAAAIENPQRRHYGVQFHPEVDLTVRGRELLHNFLFGVCGFAGTYSLESRKEVALDYIRRTVDAESVVIVLVSGGVDSTVCAALLRESIAPERIFALHVDTGFMRRRESAAVEEALRRLGLQLHVVSAAQTFLEARTTIDGKETPRLCEVTQPEVKRKIIGDTFIRVAEAHMRAHGLDASRAFLAQGTLRPDLIESASHGVSAAAGVIKTHHNDTALVRALRDSGRIIEPLRDFHKDEVRELGRQLGLPEEVVWRQPFPGPGLAIRVICADAPFHTEDDEAVAAKLRTFGSDTLRLTLVPVRTVGVQGDARSYRSLAAISTAGPPNWRDLLALARAVPHKIREVNRVVYVLGRSIGAIDYGADPLAPALEKSELLTTITPTHLESGAIEQLRAADAVVNEVLRKFGLLRRLSQVPVILFPADFGVSGGRAVCIRTFITNDFMTGVPALPGVDIPEAALAEMTRRILAEVEGIVRVVYDLTAKPPGTTEWE